jgi:serine/threonine-protein kinase
MLQTRAVGDARIGTTVADYRIEAFLGRGGQGMVYLAEHVHLGRKAALKLLPPDLAADDEFRERFIREARMAASLDHPNILPVYDAGEENGELFLAQKLVRGMDLGVYIDREGHLSPERSIEVLEPVARALDAAHHRGLVHRDVKPGNVLIQLPTDDEPERVYLTDFGLTKELVSEQDISGSGRLTKAGYFVGTPYYSAPEQIQSEPLDARTDEYSLACVLYQCLTGEVPFPRPSETAALVAHVVDPPPAPSQKVPGLPRPLDAVIATGMAKRKDDRYATCTELLRAARLALAAAGPSAPARPDHPPAPPLPIPPRPGDSREGEAGIGGAPGASDPGTGPAGAGAPGPAESGMGSSGAIAEGGSSADLAPPAAPPVPPSAPPSAPPRKGRGKLFAMIGGGVAAAVLAAVLFLTLGRNGPGPTPTGPTGTGPTGPTGPTGVVAPLGPDLFVVTRQVGQFDDVFVESTDGTVVRNLTEDPVEDFTPALSSDRTQVVFASRRDGGDNDLFVVNVDGTELRQLTQNDADDSFPVFSPDGSQIAFVSDRRGNNDIFVLDAATGNDQLPLTFDPGRDEGPSWSPDGTTIAFMTNRISGGNDTDIFTMDADGGNQSFFAGGEAIDEFPSWSPDGLRIAYDSSRNGDFDIFIRPVGGSVDQPGPRTNQNDAFATWSPDGSQIAFSKIDQDGNSVTIVAAASGGQGRATQTAQNERDPFWST